MRPLLHAPIVAREERLLPIDPDWTDASFDNVSVELDAAVVEDAGEPVPMIQAVTDGFCDQGPAGDCTVGVMTVLFERGVGVVIVVTFPDPWIADFSVYALVV
jgi:hypothetical protein